MSNPFSLFKPTKETTKNPADFEFLKPSAAGSALQYARPKSASIKRPKSASLKGRQAQNDRKPKNNGVTAKFQIMAELDSYNNYTFQLNRY